MSCNVLTPQLIWFKKIRRSPKALFVLSIFVNIGMWFERFVIVVTSLHHDFLPSSWDYFSPTIWDVTLFLGSFGLFFTLFLLFLRFLPLIAIAEVKSVMPQANPHWVDPNKPSRDHHAAAGSMTAKPVAEAKAPEPEPEPEAKAPEPEPEPEPEAQPEPEPDAKAAEPEPEPEGKADDEEEEAQDEASTEDKDDLIFSPPPSTGDKGGNKEGKDNG